MLTRKEFERMYSAELLPSSMANYGIGDIWDWQGSIFHWKLVPENTNVADICRDADLKSLLSSVLLVDAGIPNIDVTSTFTAEASLKIPTTEISIGDTLKKEDVISFSFNSVKGRNSIGFKTQIGDAIQKLRRDDGARYRKYLKGFYVTLAYYYAGSLNLNVKRTISNQAELEAKLRSLGNASLAIDASNANTISYSLANPSCPFAAQIQNTWEI